MTDIQDIWRLKNSGIVLFSRVLNPSVNDQLFGGLMTAINSIAYELDKGGLISLELNSKKFTVLKEKGLIFIASSLKQIKEKKVREE